jgi:hypothetical protein
MLIVFVREHARRGEGKNPQIKKNENLHTILHGYLVACLLLFIPSVICVVPHTTVDKGARKFPFRECIITIKETNKLL